MLTLVEDCCGDGVFEGMMVGIRDGIRDGIAKVVLITLSESGRFAVESCVRARWNCMQKEKSIISTGGGGQVHEAAARPAENSSHAHVGIEFVIGVLAGC